MGDADAFVHCPLKTNEFPEASYDPQEGHQHFKVENITVIKPPLLKNFYWQSLDIEGLNGKLASDANRLEHCLNIPTRHLNSKPLKIVFWLRSLNKHRINLSIKRVQNCQCELLQTQVGFNQFRFLYHCPHRRLINISQEVYEIRPYELVAMTVVAYFYIFGTYILTYEMSCSDSRVVVLNFRINIVTFDPNQSILTRELIPVNIQEPRRMSQAIWVRNITMQNLKFRFIARDRGFRLINSNLVVPRQSVWPLIVEYRPSDFENNLEMIMIFNGVRYYIPLSCKGVLQDYIPERSVVPINDYECADYLYVVYPNKLEFIKELNEERSLMVAVHNYNQKCMEFKWQTYSINGYFTFTFQPSQFTLKPHHSKLCVVHCKTYDKPLHFRCLPAVLEIHRILDKSTQIAQQLLTEIESIDDPKWKQDSYKEHVLLHIDLKVNFPAIQPIVVSEEYTTIAQPLMVPMLKSLMPSVESTANTIFEKLFWDYLSRSTFMRNTSIIPRTLTYEEVLQKSPYTKANKKPLEANRIAILSYISFMMAESCRDLSKNYRFVPKDILDSP